MMLSFNSLLVYRLYISEIIIRGLLTLLKLYEGGRLLLKSRMKFLLNILKRIVLSLQISQNIMDLQTTFLTKA